MTAEQRKFVEGIGNIPTDWDVKTADEVSLKITKGTTPPKADIVDYKEIPFLRVNNLGFNGSIDKKSDFVFVSRSAHEGFLARSKAYPGDILMNIVGPPLGKVSLLGHEFSEYNMNQAIVIYRLIDDVIYRDFFLSYLLSNTAQQWLQTRSKKTSGQQNLTIELCKGLPVPIPALDEQKKIAQILSTWDKAITTTEQLLANSQQQKKALMQQLLTGKKRLLDTNGVRFSGEWKSYHLSHVAVIVMGSSPKSEAYNENGIGLPLLQGNADIKNRISAPRVFTSEITKECEIGDILLSVRAPVGTVAISEHKACIGRGIAALHAKPNFDQSFIYQFLLWFEPKWGSLSQGSTFESINSDDIKNLKIKVPNFGEQQKIAAVISTADQEIFALQQKFDALKQEKKALMQQLLTGKRRVKIDNKEVA